MIIFFIQVIFPNYGVFLVVIVLNQIGLFLNLISIILMMYSIFFPCSLRISFNFGCDSQQYLGINITMLIFQISNAYFSSDFLSAIKIKLIKLIALSSSFEIII